ncbi:MAG TPA: methyltransferase domain-containing protein [Gammaproteobacteria bacterium]|nr:methyltransferase domain-containing protein [Gammaproteobacteria bacterium]
MHESSMDKMRQFREAHLREKEETPLNILDLGSLDVVGNYTYREIFNSPDWSYTGVDMAAGKNVDIVLKNPYSWKEIKSNSVDVFVSGQAFEHVEYIWILMLEVSRVLKPGGICCIIAPAGGFEHRYPVDCWRFYPDGMNALAKFSRLTTVEAYTQWEPQGYTEDNSDVWQDSVLVCRKPQTSTWASIKNHVINRIQFHALAIGLDSIMDGADRTPVDDEQSGKERMASFEEIRELRDRLQKNDFPSRADFEKLLASYDDTRAAYEHTRRAYEDTRKELDAVKQLHETLPSREDFDNLRKAYEDTRTAYEHTRGAYEHTLLAYEDVRKELETMRQSNAAMPADNHSGTTKS